VSVQTDSPPLVRHDLFSLDAPCLLAGRCAACEQLSFPAAAGCPHCGETDLTLAPLARRGMIFSFTIVRFCPPGYAGPVPYAVGVVELPDGIRVASTLLADSLNDLAIDAGVHFRVIEIPTAEGPVLSYAFAMEGS
jgi:uncharacterized OB-fold protein